MWLYLKTGFYSIVHKPPCKEDELLVRLRCKHDIDKLQELLKEKYQFNGAVINSPKADYAYRMTVPKKILASLISCTVLELDYNNFKNTIRDGACRRHDAYLKCWEAMYGWQRDFKKV